MLVLTVLKNTVRDNEKKMSYFVQRHQIAKKVVVNPGSLLDYKPTYERIFTRKLPFKSQAIHFKFL